MQNILFFHILLSITYGTVPIGTVGIFTLVLKGDKQCCGSGIRCLFDLWIRDPEWVKNKDKHEQPGSYFREPRNIFLDKNSLMQIRDPRWKKFGSEFRDGKIYPGWENFGSGIRDNHPGSATLVWWQVIKSTLLKKYTYRGLKEKEVKRNFVFEI
jgi:hypothetical protein